MTFNDYKKLLLENQDKCGIACWCANCGGNLMHAPVQYNVKCMRETFDFCFSECIHCKMKNPPLHMAQVFTDWEFKNCPTSKRSYYTAGRKERYVDLPGGGKADKDVLERSKKIK